MLLRLLPGLSPRANESTFLISRPLRSTPTPASKDLTATTGRSASERRDRHSMPPASTVGTLPLATLEAYDPGSTLLPRVGYAVRSPDSLLGLAIGLIRW